MTIKTKLDIGGPIVYLRQNEVQEHIVRSIDVNIDVHRTKVKYISSGGNFVEEENAFASKEELIKSL